MTRPETIGTFRLIHVNVASPAGAYTVGNARSSATSCAWPSWALPLTRWPITRRSTILAAIPHAFEADDDVPIVSGRGWRVVPAQGDLDWPVLEATPQRLRSALERARSAPLDACGARFASAHARSSSIEEELDAVYGVLMRAEAARLRRQRLLRSVRRNPVIVAEFGCAAPAASPSRSRGRSIRTDCGSSPRRRSPGHGDRAAGVPPRALGSDGRVVDDHHARTSGRLLVETRHAAREDSRRAEAAGAARRMFRLDDDLAPFYAADRRRRRACRGRRPARAGSWRVRPCSRTSSRRSARRTARGRRRCA